MRKNYLQSEQEFVDEAKAMAESLIAREYRGHGDTDPAMRRIEARHGLDYQLLWSLKYRIPKTIAAGAYMRLRSIYEAVCEQQATLLERDLAHARTYEDAADAPAIRAAERTLMAEKAREATG